MSAHLRPCPACTRHARVSEHACPFCGKRFAESFRANARPQAPAVRLSRAALAAFGAGTLAFAPACSSGSSNPLYGAPPPEYTDDGGTADAQVVGDAGSDAGLPGVAPVYGAPVMEPADAEPDHVGFTPLYGISPGH